MTVTGGTSPASNGAIAQGLSGLQIPGELSDETKVQQTVAQAIPEPLSPPQIQVPQSRPNVSQAAVDADLASRIDIPSFDLETSSQEPTDPPVSIPSEPQEEDDLPEGPSSENWKKLRGIVKTERQTKKELEAKLNETTEKLSRYEKGEVQPEVLQAKDKRIAELEPYQRIVDLKLSREYQEEVAVPARELTGELERLGSDYGVPPNLMHQAAAIENRKERNQFLSRHFDDVGALEVKRVIDELHQVGERAIEMEKNPQEAMQSLKAQFIERQNEEKTHRAKVFEVTAKDAWNAALEKTKKEAAFPELIMHPTDTGYNKTVVEPIQARASTQYGALVRKLNENGLKTLPPDLASGLARMVLLSIGGALTLEAKSHAESRTNAILENTRRTSGYSRPAIGSNNGSVHTQRATPRPALDPRAAGDEAAKFFQK